ncbi:OmpA family protein [Fulvivirgaceae bacterium BMA12]|uniref:OmpA family protein n=1 Tax=Agaribacillus aureus TaxID=3051825 RepID=A0ABT8LF86_9BACT|nr:OmpA family protein [Fulvivirgaceae bacterium BMA12]
MLLTIFLCLPAIGQKKKKKFMRLPKLSDSSQSALTFQIFPFSNVNKVAYFADKGLSKSINKLDQARNWNKLYPLLENYIKNFGIENFYKETRWLWRYGKLTEMRGDMAKAKAIYKLVLKHHRKETDLKKVFRHLDSLIVNEKDYFVPLEHYYELVEFRKQVDTLIPPRGVLLNMGQHINSDLADYGPTLGIHDNTLIFTSKRNQTTDVLRSRANEDLFYSKGEDGYWEEAKAFEGINTPFNEGSACLSKDGTTLFFARCNAPDGYGNCDLYEAHLQENGVWGNIKNLGESVNGASWDSQPSLSHGEDTLYFASDRVDGFGLSDIYFTYKDSKGNWAKARNLGPMVNTRGNEVSPFYHPSSPLLYFSSTGHLLNFGEYDIYKSYHKNNRWSEPINIGPLVNGKGSEYYFTIDANSQYLFYAKSKDENLSNLDLFSFPLPMGAQPNATVQLQGSLTEVGTDKPLSGMVSIIDLDHGIEVAPKFLRPDGSFSFDLINNNNYLLIIHGDDFFRIEELFYLDGDAEYHRKTETFSSRIEFSTLEFDNGKSDLKIEMYGDLNKIVDFMMDNPEFNLKISGHTDSDGSEELNLKLSDDRAQSIKEYLTYFGKIDESRIDAKGYGSSKPIVEEKTDEDKKLNRRVEFEIIRDKAIEN